MSRLEQVIGQIRAYGEKEAAARYKLEKRLTQAGLEEVESLKARLRGQGRTIDNLNRDLKQRNKHINELTAQLRTVRQSVTALARL